MHLTFYQFNLICQKADDVRDKMRAVNARTSERAAEELKKHELLEEQKFLSLMGL